MLNKTMTNLDINDELESFKIVKSLIELGNEEKF